MKKKKRTEYGLLLKSIEQVFEERARTKKGNKSTKKKKEEGRKENIEEDGENFLNQ